MNNYERVRQSSICEMAKIIMNEFCGMCRSCKYYYTSSCKYDEDGKVANPYACEKGIEKWLEDESENRDSK